MKAPPSFRTVFFSVFTLASLFYWWPNHDLPVQIWDAWIYQMQVASFVDQNIIPEALKVHSAFDVGFVEGFVKYWHSFVGRYFVSYAGIMQATASLGEVHSDFWIVIDLLFLSAAIAFFFLIGRHFKISPWILSVFAMALILRPAAIWNPWLYSTDSESPAVFFLFFAAYLALKKPDLLWQTVSASCLFLALTCKETFALYWPFVLSLHYLHEKKVFWRGVLVHGLSAFLFLAFVLYLKWTTVPLTGSYLASSDLGLMISLAQIKGVLRFFLEMTFLTPFPLDKLGKLLALGFLIYFGLSLRGVKIEKKKLFIVLSALFGVLAQLLTYLIFKKDYTDFHILPLNFVFYFLFAWGIQQLEWPKVPRVKVLALAILAFLAFYSYRSNEFQFLLAFLLTLSFGLVVLALRRRVSKEALLNLSLVFLMGLPNFYLPYDSSAQLWKTRGVWQELVDEMSGVRGVVDLHLKPESLVEAPLSLYASLLRLGNYNIRFRIHAEQPPGYHKSVIDFLNREVSDETSSGELTLRSIRSARPNIDLRLEHVFKNLPLIFRPFELYEKAFSTGKISNISYEFKN